MVPTEREMTMAHKIKCPACNETPYWRWVLEGGGKACSLCGYVRPTKSRRSAKRDRLDRLIAELLSEGAA